MDSLQTGNGFARGGDRWPILIVASVCRFNEPPPTTAILVAPRTRWRWPNDETIPHSATWLIPTRNLRYPQLPEWREALPSLRLRLLPHSLVPSRKKPFLSGVAAWWPRALNVPAGNSRRIAVVRNIYFRRERRSDDRRYRTETYKEGSDRSSDDL